MSIYREHNRSHTRTNVRHVYKIGVWTRWDVRIGTIGWDNHSWKYFFLIGDERVINLQRTKVYVFLGFCVVLWEDFEDSQSNDAWEQRLVCVQNLLQNYRNFDRIDGEPMECEWNIFQGFSTLQLSEEVKRLLFRLNETPENLTRRILFMSMFNDISRRTKDDNEWAGKCQTRILACEKIWKKDNGHLLVLVKVVLYQWRLSTWSMGQNCWKDVGLNSQKRRMFNFPCYESHCPEGRLKSEVHGKLSIHYAADMETIETIFENDCLCKPAQSLRSKSRRCCEEHESFHEENGETRCDGKINRAQCDQERRSFGLWWPRKSRSSIANNMENELKVVTTRQIEEILYGCRNSECS